MTNPPWGHAIRRVVRNARCETAVAYNGLEAGALLPAFKTLVVSADIEEGLRQAFALGAHGVVHKPFSNDALLSPIIRPPPGGPRPRHIRARPIPLETHN